MGALPFDTALMDWLVEHRDGGLLPLFQLASFMGEVEGYVLIVTLIYVAFDKSLAVRLGALALLAMVLNHVLKILVKNPRPFLAEGTHFENWAVTAQRAHELATEYSTPSGHAMAAAAFYGYLLLRTRQRWTKAAAAAAIVVIGVSRPYLGVHYAEDILIGWAIGLVVAWAAVRYANDVGSWWSRLADAQRVALCVAATIALWWVTVVVNGNQVEGQPRAFLAYAGLLTGMLVAQPFELRWVAFDPGSSSPLAKAARYLLAVFLVLATLTVLKAAFAAVAAEFSPAGYALQYTRYAVAGVMGIALVPWLLKRVGLVEPSGAQQS
jgi:membrane-associated phospholipid phosphatase